MFNHQIDFNVYGKTFRLKYRLLWHALLMTNNPEVWHFIHMKLVLYAKLHYFFDNSDLPLYSFYWVSSRRGSLVAGLPWHLTLVVSQSIDRIRQRYAASGDVKDLPRSGRPRATNRAEDRHHQHHAQKLFYQCSNDDQRIRQQRGAGGIPVSVQIIRNRLHAAGLKSSVPVKKPCLSQRQRAARLQFARNHVRWNRKQWRTVTFSDESRFCLRHTDGRLRVWRRNGERHAEVNVQPRHAYNGGSVMVWAGVTADRRTDLVVVPGILTGQR